MLNGKRLTKIIAIILSIMTLSSAISLPAVAQVVVEQSRYNNILNADLQGEPSKPTVQPLANTTGSVQQSDNTNEAKTDDQKKADYKKNLDNDTNNYTSDRYIVKYSDEKSVPQFSNGGKRISTGKSVDAGKITAAGIASSMRIEGTENTELAVFSLDEGMKPDNFMSALKTGLLMLFVDSLETLN